MFKRHRKVELYPLIWTRSIDGQRQSYFHSVKNECNWPEAQDNRPKIYLLHY